MSGVEERLDKVEGRLGSLENGVNELRGEVGELRDKVDGLGGEVGDLRGEVQKLRILGEQTASELKLMADVQGHHSTRLDEMTKALEPLAGIDNFIRSVADDHEVRIKRLEKRAGISQNP
jgi:archaellum component FlaC